jgi:hypothetical protein
MQSCSRRDPRPDRIHFDTVVASRRRRRSVLASTTRQVISAILPPNKELNFSEIRQIENWQGRLPDIIRCIETNTNLESVNVDEYPDDDDFYGGIITASLREAVIRNPNVKILRFGWVGVVPLHLVSGFSRMRNLQKLEFDSTETRDLDPSTTARMLEASFNLQELVLDACVGDAAAQAIARSQWFPTALVRIKLKDCYMTEAGLSTLGRALEHYSSLVTLEIIERDPIGMDPCEFSVPVAKVFAQALQKNTSITKLRIEFDLISSLAAKYFFEGLAVNTTIRDFHIESLELGQQGSLAAAHLIRRNQTLESVCLTGMYSDMAVVGIENEASCYEGGIHIVPISQALAINKGLKRFALYDWVMRTDGMEGFEPKSKNNTLESLDLRGIHIHGGIASICEIIVQSTAALTSLNLVACKIVDKGMTNSVCNLLKQCSSLNSVALCTNWFSDAGAQSLAQVLQESTTLRTVNLKFNHRVREKGTRALLDAVRDQTHAELERVLMPVALTRPQTAELEFYVQRNQWSMRLLRVKLPIALWPQMLQKTDQHSSSCGLDLLNFLVKEKCEELCRNANVPKSRKRKALEQPRAIEWPPPM